MNLFKIGQPLSSKRLSETGRIKEIAR